MHRTDDHEEDIFRDSTMTFGEHLEELRKCLFKAILGLLAGVVIGLFFGDWVVQIINRPLENALTAYYQKESKDKIAAAANTDGSLLASGADQYTALIDQGMLTQKVYVNPQELAAQLKRFYPEQFKDLPDPPAPAPPPAEATDAAEGAAAAQPKSIELTDLAPLFLWHPAKDDTRIQAKSLKPHETFMVYLKGSLLIGALLASPWVFYQVWSFVAAGLYPHEKRYVNVYLPFSVLLFFLGVAVAYFFVFGPVLGFLFSFNRWLNITPDLRISEWLGFVLMLPLGFGISFQLPLVMLFLHRIGVFTVEIYLSYWRVAILVIFVMAALFTPPDPWSMSLLALPLTLLYFGGILLCKYMPKGKPLLPLD